MDIEIPSKVNTNFEFDSWLQKLYIVQSYFLSFNIQFHILAMDTLSASTAGVDAAKGKTLEEMSDLVGVVSYIIQYSLFYENQV